MLLEKKSSILLPTHEIISNSITIDDYHKFSFHKQYCMPLEHGLIFFPLSLKVFWHPNFNLFTLENFLTVGKLINMNQMKESL